MIGNGSFGVVYQAKLCETGEMVAIKKVLQDKRFKNRELQIMRRLDHCNIVSLLYFFYTSGEKKVRQTSSSVFLSLFFTHSGRDIPEPGTGVHTRNSVQGCETVQQTKTDYPRHLHQVVHVPTLQVLGLHPLKRYLSP